MTKQDETCELRRPLARSHHGGAGITFTANASTVAATPITRSLAFMVPTLAMTLAAPLHAQTLNDPASRITDQAIHADQATYVAQQGRIKGLNDSGRHRVASYSLAKAQCWLDVSFHEYNRNDRSAFVQEALTESFKITQYLAQGGDVDAPKNPAWQSPLINGAARLREDLWAAALQGRDLAGAVCAGQQLACAEVELVHGGNEFNQQGWRHAKPYIQIAEDLLGQAQAAASTCLSAAPSPAPLPPAEPPLPVPTPPTPQPPAPAPTSWSLNAQVLFDFDRKDLAHVLPASRVVLDTLMQQIAAQGLTLSAITLTGHADVSNNTGNSRYNVRLAQARAKTIRDFLVSRGIDAALIRVEAKGDSNQVAQCEAVRKDRAAFVACLAPNRRVEISVRGTQR